MKKRNFTVEQIIQILTEGEKGMETIASTCRKYGIAEGTYYTDGRENIITSLFLLQKN